MIGLRPRRILPGPQVLVQCWTCAMAVLPGGCPSGLASAMAPDMPISMLVTIIVCLMGYSLLILGTLLQCRVVRILLVRGGAVSGNWRKCDGLPDRRNLAEGYCGTGPN